MGIWISQCAFVFQTLVRCKPVVGKVTKFEQVDRGILTLFVYGLEWLLNAYFGSNPMIGGREGVAFELGIHRGMSQPILNSDFS